MEAGSPNYQCKRENYMHKQERCGNLMEVFASAITKLWMFLADLAAPGMSLMLLVPSFGLKKHKSLNQFELTSLGANFGGNLRPRKTAFCDNFIPLSPLNQAFHPFGL
jgi:hypothetical protein